MSLFAYPKRRTTDYTNVYTATNTTHLRFNQHHTAPTGHINSKGFTIIELLMTLAIISITLGLGVPSLSSTIKRMQTKATTAALYTAFNKAKSYAITNHAHVYLCGSDKEYGCSKRWSKNLLMFSDDNQNQTADPEEILYSYMINYKAGYIKSRIAYGKNYTRIRSHGEASYTGSFLVCQEGGDSRDYRRVTWNLAARTYFGIDRNGDGVIEDTQGSAIKCD